MQRANPIAGKFWIIALAASLSLMQADAFAARPWGDPSDKPGNGDKTGGGKPNKPPTIEGTPSTVAEVDEYYSFQPSAKDRDGDKLTFSISNKPAWAAFDTSKGFLSGFPGSADAGRITNNIVISVSDGSDAASLSAFSIAVGNGPQNSPPSISGSPAGEVIATESYNFTPTASDPDGDTLQFRVSNLPGWASFNTSTGRLYGTPGDADIGLYENIRISVTDGTASASTGYFSISVVHTTNGTTTLSWAAPSENVDGSALTDLAGYRIYYGLASRQYDHQLEVPDAATMTVVIDNLTGGSWYFAATALNSDGLESDFSNEVKKAIQ